MLAASSPRFFFVQRMDRFVLEYHIRQFGTKQLARRNLNQLCKSVTRLAPNNPRIKASELPRMRVSRGDGGRGRGRGRGEGDGEKAMEGEEEIPPGRGGRTPQSCAGKRTGGEKINKHMICRDPTSRRLG